MKDETHSHDADDTNELCETVSRRNPTQCVPFTLVPSMTSAAACIYHFGRR